MRQRDCYSVELWAIHDFVFDKTKSFSGGHIYTLKGIYMQGFDKIPLVVSEEMR